MSNVICDIQNDLKYSFKIQDSQWNDPFFADLEAEISSSDEGEIQNDFQNDDGLSNFEKQLLKDVLEDEDGFSDFEKQLLEDVHGELIIFP